ncbi:MAG: WG repeat-containing protein [Zoogloeaceae bacterium]|nr:WG repeat-containing protein [Zoogloeaceae bacterium]
MQSIHFVARRVVLGVLLGMLPFFVQAQEGVKWAWAVKPRFDGASDFAANGLARVVIQGKPSYINAKGEEVIPPRFDRAEDFANGLALVKVNGKGIGYINEKGEEVVPPRFEDAGNFAANGLAAVRENGKWGYIRALGDGSRHAF